MREIDVNLGERSYKIAIDKGNLTTIGRILRDFSFSNKPVIVSNPTVFDLYGESVINSLKNYDYDVTFLLIPDGEEYKNSAWYDYIMNELLKQRLDRKSVLIALGGGVIGDITGFAASTYMRGIDYIQVPTTLLSQVDSSVGGKTGINHYLGKNMIGAFYQPRYVLIDVDTLDTLPDREIRAGMAEVIKYGVIWDKKFFSYLKDNRQAVLSLEHDAITHIIGRSCQIKAEVVSKDEREAGLRAVLNFGHTVGHGIETSTGYKKFLHGESVAIGMYIEAGVASLLSMLEYEAFNEIRELIDAYELPYETPPDISADMLMESMSIDKKVLSGDIRFVLPEEIGRVKMVGGINKETIEKAIALKG